MRLVTKTADTPTPAWAWLIFLLPLFMLIFVSLAFYMTGYNHAKSLSESLIQIDATVISVKKELCRGNHGRHTCYRIELLGSLGGVNHKYQTYDMPNGRFSYTKDSNGNLSVSDSQRIQEILVDPHPGNVDISKMYWSRSEPVEDFYINSVMLLVLIAIGLFMAPIGFWRAMKK